MFCLRSLVIPLLCAVIFSSHPAQPAQAADLETALSGLAEKSFKDRLKAVDAIAASQDERAVEILDALVKRKLFITKADGHIVLADPDNKGSYLFAFNGQTAGEFAKSALKKVKVNNRMRSAVRKAMGSLTLGSPDRERRLAAARSIFNTRDSSTLPLLAEAIARETDTTVKLEMERAQAAALLASDAAESEKLAAIGVIARMANQDAVALLTQVSSNSGGAVAGRAEQAIAEMQSSLALWATAQNVLFGISLGSVLLLAAIGLAITFGVMGVINMAHGEMVMIGAYVTFVVQDVIRASMPELFDWSLLIALPLAFAVTALIGIAMERGIIRFLYGRPLETLLATWGVSLILQQAVRSIFGPNNRMVGNPSWMSGSLELGQLTLTYNRICIIAFTLVVFAALFVAMRKTSFGLQMRAVVQNRRMSAAMGIRTKWVDALTFGLGSGIAGLAGVAISQIDNVGPNLGQSYIIDSFMVVVFGGVGNLWGTLVGAMTLGVANKFLEPYSGAVLAKILVLVFIILFIQKRPRGLFALKGRGAEA